MIDTTASMRDDIAAVKSDVTHLVDELERFASSVEAGLCEPNLGSQCVADPAQFSSQCRDAHGVCSDACIRFTKQSAICAAE